MKSNLITVLSAFLILCIAGPGCAPRMITGDGSTYTESLPLTSFSKLNFSVGGADLVLSKGDKPGIRIEGEKNVVDLLVVQQQDSVLSIHYAPGKRVKSTHQVKFWVSTPVIDAIDVAGSGTVHSTDQFRNTAMHIDSHGSGKVDMNLDVDLLAITTHGSTKITISGVTKQLDCNIAGSAGVNASQLSVLRRSMIHIAGSGHIQISTNGSIGGRIDGSGTLTYRGAPDSINVQTSGSGSIRKG